MDPMKQVKSFVLDPLSLDIDKRISTRIFIEHTIKEISDKFYTEVYIYIPVEDDGNALMWLRFNTSDPIKVKYCGKDYAIVTTPVYGDKEKINGQLYSKYFMAGHFNSLNEAVRETKKLEEEIINAMEKKVEEILGAPLMSPQVLFDDGKNIVYGYYAYRKEHNFNIGIRLYFFPTDSSGSIVSGLFKSFRDLISSKDKVFYIGYCFYGPDNRKYVILRLTDVLEDPSLTSRKLTILYTNKAKEDAETIRQGWQYVMDQKQKERIDTDTFSFSVGGEQVIFRVKEEFVYDETDLCWQCNCVLAIPRVFSYSQKIISNVLKDDTFNDRGDKWRRDKVATYTTNGTLYDVIDFTVNYVDTIEKVKEEADGVVKRTIDKVIQELEENITNKVKSEEER